MKKITTKTTLIVLSLLVFISMLSLTIYMRDEYKKKPTSLSLVKNVSQITALVEVDMYYNTALYRKLWTYNVIIFLFGVMMFCAIKSKDGN